MPVRRLLILGCGYVGERLALTCIRQGIEVIALTRNPQRATALQAMGITAVVAASPDRLSHTLLAAVDAVVDSIPLSRDVEGVHASQLSWLPKIAPGLVALRWAAYLSTTGVYGDADGDWVDEQHACRPTSARGRERLLAERCWLDSGLPAEVFRLAGIYGPGRNIFERLRAGGYKAVAWQPPHWSSRCHVDDIVAAVVAAMGKPLSGRIVNVADDEPLPHAEYVCELARMIGAPAPDILTPEQADGILSPQVLEFFLDNKRVSNRLLHRELLGELHYPSFRSAIPELIAGG